MTPVVVESRIVRAAVAVVSLIAIAIVARPDNRRRHLVDASDRAHALAVAASWREAVRTQRCPRPALREPTTGDGSSILVEVTQSLTIASNMDQASCVARILGLGLEEPCKAGPCPMVKLGALPRHPEILEACAPIFDQIEQLAHATEGCSPENAAGEHSETPRADLGVFAFRNAVRLRVAPLFVSGELGDAARYVADGMRFADDYGRNTTTAAAMMSFALFLPLADTLEEILVDPRLTPSDARAIARDLDVLRASMPPFDAIVLNEVVWVTNEIDRLFWITDDHAQDKTLALLGMERWLQTYQRACAGATTRTCLDQLNARWPFATISEDSDFARDIASGLDDHDVRERIIERHAAGYAWFKHFLRRMAYRDFALRVLRMQAELRTLPADVCHDPQRRRALLAPWLGDDITIGNEPEPTLQPPAWQLGGLIRAGRARVLRCR